MAYPQNCQVSYTSPYYAVEPVMGYWDVDGGYETSPEQQAHPGPLCDFIEASSPTTAAAVRQDLLDIEEELSSNYLSHQMAPTSGSPELAGPALDVATHEPLPSDLDVSLAQLLGSLHFNYLDDPVYQIGVVRNQYQDAASYEEYAAHAFRDYHGAHGFAALPSACVAPEDLHRPSYGYTDAHATFAAHGEWRARRALRRDASSPAPITRRPPAQSEVIVPGFTSLRRRNVQVTTPMPATAIPPPTSRSSMDRWKCPYCEFVQSNRRGPDLRRHMGTHRGNNSSGGVPVYLCCGVPLHEAAEHGVPDDFVNEQEPQEFDGLLMVGGCRRTFSRKDAYMRHLTRQAGRCFGDAQAWYQPGNVERAA